MERLDHLLDQIERLPYYGKRHCMESLNERLLDLQYYLEAIGPKAGSELKHLQGCIWLLYEGHHQKTDDEKMWTFYYIKDKVNRICHGLLEAKQNRKVAA